jgi:CRP-like cAMP-binding protein
VEVFRQFIEKYTPISDSDWEIIAACFQCKHIEKEQIILEEGQVCKHLYFLESGLLRYFIIKEGVDITKFFTVAPYCFTSQMSFNAEIPAKENIQALEASVVWQITLEQANALFELKSWAIFARKIIQEVQYFIEAILQAVQTETAAYRYEKMLKEQPELIQRIPLKHLASFFGIAPQSLSRIRKKVFGK